MDIFFIHKIISWISAAYDNRTVTANSGSVAPSTSSPHTGMPTFKKILQGVFVIMLMILVFGEYTLYVGGFILACGVAYIIYKLFIWIAPSWGPWLLKYMLLSIVVSTWIFMFMQLFTFTPLNYTLILIPTMYLLFSTIYILAKQNLVDSFTSNLYTYGLIVFMYIIAIFVTKTPVYVLITTLISSFIMRNQIQYMSYIPYLLLFSMILMIIASLIVVISISIYISTYTSKTGEPPTLSGLYENYYENYMSSMKTFVTCGILMTLAYKTYETNMKIDDKTKMQPWFSWILTNVSGFIMAATVSTELFNSANFIDISRNLII